MTKRTLTLLVLLAITNLPIGCREDDDGCGFDGVAVEAKITELTPFIGTYSNSEFSSSKNKDYSRAAINISITDMEYTEITHIYEKGYFFINSAYACDPVPPELTQAIDSITITSEAAVFFGGRTYRSGENLIDLLKVTRYLYDYEETTVHQFIEEQNNELEMFGYAGANAVFQFLDKPDSAINQTFTFRFDFSDLERIEVKTPIFEVDN